MGEALGDLLTSAVASREEKAKKNEKKKKP